MGKLTRADARHPLFQLADGPRHVARHEVGKCERKCCANKNQETSSPKGGADRGIGFG